MPNRHSAARFDTHAALKHNLVQEARLAIHDFDKDATRASKVDVSWDTLIDHWPRKGRVSWASSSGAQVEEQATVDPELEACSGDSSSTSSAESALDTTTDDIVEPFEELKWFMASGASGHLHINESGKCACGYKLRLPAEGNGIRSALQCNRKCSPDAAHGYPPQKSWSGGLIHRQSEDRSTVASKRRR
jgi:hypothetical protein